MKKISNFSPRVKLHIDNVSRVRLILKVWNSTNDVSKVNVLNPKFRDFKVEERSFRIKTLSISRDLIRFRRRSCRFEKASNVSEINFATEPVMWLISRCNVVIWVSFKKGSSGCATSGSIKRKKNGNFSSRSLKPKIINK